MNRLPALSAPLDRQQLHQQLSQQLNLPWSPYRRPDLAGDQSRPEIISPSHHHAREPESESGAPQLPSLRTLLQPQLLDSRLPEHSPQMKQLNGVRLPAASSSHGATTSPTLKRRHDVDFYGSDRIGDDLASTRAPPVLRPSVPSGSTHDAQLYSMPGSYAHDFVPNFRPVHSEPVHKIQRPASTASGVSGSSDSVAALSLHPGHDDPMDITTAPARRRVEPTQRAPAQTSRCVGQREVPGEGLCYIYEDGSYCRVVIDGEPVNPSWGITKAGKPRKRLAQACLTCREKKIKCEPAVPKCHQCAKSQRACRGGFNPSSISSISDEPSPSSTTPPFKTRSRELLSPRVEHDQAKDCEDSLSTLLPRKALRTIDTGDSIRSSSKHFKTFSSSSAPAGRDMSAHSFNPDWDSPVNGHGSSMNDDRRQISHPADHLALGWEQDPYDTDPGLVTHLLDLYFTHVGCATYCMFPRKQFTTWVETCRHKSQDDRMLVYTLLALGSVFAADSEKRSIGKQFAGIAAYAIGKRFGRFSLQLCQSRLMLALYNFARGKATEAWDFCGSSLRTISALKLNTEEGVKDIPEDGDLDFGFDRPTLEECRRRTFWSGFLMDRYNGFCGGTLFVIHPEDTFLRLPCQEHEYGSLSPSETPLFDFDLLCPNAASYHVGGAMAYLTLISAIWGEVMAHTGRAVHRPDSTYLKLYEDFYTQTSQRLDAWHDLLPPHLRFSPQNLDRAIISNYGGTFISLHALYHTTHLRLNRHARTTVLSPSSLRRNLAQCTRNAASILTIMQALSPASRSQRLPSNVSFTFSTPFPGYAFMMAVDVLGAGGAKTDLGPRIHAISAGLACVDELSAFWASARAQHKAISTRLKQLAELALTEDQAHQIRQVWRLGASLETAGTKRDDVVYGVPDAVFFEVIGQAQEGNQI